MPAADLRGAGPPCGKLELHAECRQRDEYRRHDRRFGPETGQDTHRGDARAGDRLPGAPHRGLPVVRTSQSVSQPPKNVPSAPASSTRLASQLESTGEAPRASCKYVGYHEDSTS